MVVVSIAGFWGNRTTRREAMGRGSGREVGSQSCEQEEDGYGKEGKGKLIARNATPILQYNGKVRNFGR